MVYIVRRRAMNRLKLTNARVEGKNLMVSAVAELGNT
jgi:hypothetical protein